MAQGIFEKRRNAKALRQVQEIEQREGRQLSSFAVHGTQKFQWSNAATIVLSVFMVMFVVAAALGYVLLPGGLILVVGYNATKPRRTVSLNGETVTVWEHSFWSAKVTDALVIEHRSLLQVGSFVLVPGALPVAVSSNELAELQRADLELGPARTLAAATPPPPPTPNPSLV